MPRIAPKALLATSLLAIAAPLPWQQAAAASECSLRQVASIPAHLSPTGNLVMDVTVNGTTPARLTLATDSNFSYLTEAFARRMGMPIVDLHGDFRSTGRRTLEQATRINSLQLGTARSNFEGFALLDGGTDGSDGSAVGGLGADYLANYDVEIDLADGKVNFWSQDHCPGKVVYWAKDYFQAPLTFRNENSLVTIEDGRGHRDRFDNYNQKRPEIDVVVDDRTLHAMIAPDYANVVLRQAVAESAFDLSPDTPAMTKDGIWRDSDGKAFDRYAHAFGQINLGDVTVHDTPAEIKPINIASHDPTTGSHLNELNTDQPDLYLGMKLLQKFRLYIAYREAVLYYTIAAPEKPAAAQ